MYFLTEIGGKKKRFDKVNNVERVLQKEEYVLERCLH